MRIRAVLVGAISLIAGVASTADAMADDRHTRLGAVMDPIFGAGNWRETGGYRTPERENELRAQGALTVPTGALSHHSMGRRDAPGAYDVVVDRSSPGQAAAKLRRSGAPFRTILAEGAHGTQGPHLHLEPYSTDFKAGAPRPPGIEWIVKDPTPAEQAVNLLHARSAEGEADAQLRLGEIYAEGRAAPKDLIAAFVWTALAAANRAADSTTRGAAEHALAGLTRRMKPEQLLQARRFVGEPMGPSGSADCAAPEEQGLILVIRPDRPQDSCARSPAVLTSSNPPINSLR